MKNIVRILAVLAGIALLSFSLQAQYSVKNVNMASVNIAWGFYSPNDEIKLVWDQADFGGVGLTGRVLFRTNLLNSRLSIGAEYALHSLASQNNGGSYTITYVGAPVSSGSTKDVLLAHSVQAIGDYLVAGLPSVDLHLGAGVGVVFFSGQKDYATVPVEIPASVYGTPIDMETSVPAPSMDAEVSSSLRFLAAFPVARHTTLDPEVRYFATFGKQAISIIQIAVGVSYWW